MKSTTKEDNKNPAPVITPVPPVKVLPPQPPKIPNIFKPSFGGINRNVRSNAFMSNNRGRR